MFRIAILLISLGVVLGRHDDLARRRHHSRSVHRFHQKGAEAVIKKRDCENGSWQCVGTELQHCNFNDWIPVSNCTGDNIVCSADSRAVGCIWTWSLDEDSDTPVTVSPLPTSLLTAGPSSTLPSSSSSLGDVVAIATTPTSSPTTSFSTSSAPASLTTQAEASVIGGRLYAGGGWYGDSSTSRRWKDRTSTKDWYGTSTTSTSSQWAASSSYDDGSYSSSTQDWYNAGTPSTSSAAWQATSTSAAWDNTASSTQAWTTSSSSIRHASKTSSAADAVSTGGGGNTPSGTYFAPHYVIYADEWLSQMPSASDISSYNRFILAFWMSNSGEVDNAQAWAQFDASYRQQVLDEYHAAGIALMVSAFGSTDSPTTDGADPTQTAQDLAAWVKQYNLDGVDVDYEDMTAMNNDQAEVWLITFQEELRRLLPAPYLISHAPVAPWFTSGDNYPSGAYVDVHKKTGDGINFYNIQFYNQGSGVYEDCDSLIYDSGNSWPDTSAMQINTYAGVPLDKIVIGKPLDAGAASNGYVDETTLATCIAEAQALGWNGGVMFWEWSTTIGNSFMATVRG